MEVFIHREPWQRHFRLVFKEGESFGVAIEMQSLPEGRAIPLDSMPTLDTKAAQMLADELWRHGIRPTEGKGSAGAMGATERHLNDMRKIVGKKLDVEL